MNIPGHFAEYRNASCIHFYCYADCRSFCETRLGQVFDASGPGACVSCISGIKT